MNTMTSTIFDTEQLMIDAITLGDILFKKDASTYNPPLTQYTTKALQKSLQLQRDIPNMLTNKPVNESPSETTYKSASVEIGEDASVKITDDVVLTTYDVEEEAKST